MNKLIFSLFAIATAITVNAKTLVAYYSYTNNVARVVNELKSQIDCDIIEIEPTEKGLDYAANNYAIGSAQNAAIRNNPNDASSYPAIDEVNVDLSQYDTVILACPLWWSQMAAPFQTFLFKFGSQMASKNIGLIVSSASSGISGVESDAKRLVPNGKFLSPSLWIRSSQTSNAKSLIEQWLREIDYSSLTAGIKLIDTDNSGNWKVSIYNLNGNYAGNDLSSLQTGIYIVNQNGISTKIKL